MFGKIGKADRLEVKSPHHLTETELVQSANLVYKCEPCNLQSNSLFQLQEHLKGKRHKMNVSENSNKSDDNVVVGEKMSVDYNPRYVWIAFTFLGLSIINYLYLFFILIDAKRNHDLFYF